MNGEIYTLKQLEGMDNWRATFYHIIGMSTPMDDRATVCLMKNMHGAGYFWKMPGKSTLEICDLKRLQEAISIGRLSLKKGTLPRGVKQREILKMARKKSKVA